MSVRYKKLFSLEHRLYASQAPVLIESGALLQEQESGTLLCQLCFRNIQERPIKSLRAVVRLLDAEGALLDRPVDHRYQDLDLARDGLCGRDVGIVLPSSRALSFTAQVSQVTFDDGDVWAADTAWEPLPEQYTLEDHFVSAAEVHRFQRRFGRDCSFAPLAAEELWFCTCGAVNFNTEGRCHRCRRRRSALLGRGAELPASEDPEELEDDGLSLMPERLRSRIRGLAIGAATLVLLGVLALVLIPRFRSGAAKAETIPTPPVSAAEPTEDPELAALRAAYEEALALQDKADYAPLEDEQALYLSAAEAFEALGDYEDSADRALQCRDKIRLLQETLWEDDYTAAQALLEQRHYSEARKAFLALADYKDSAALANEALYQKALALYRYMEDNSVRGFTASLSADPEVESVVALPRDQLLRLGLAGLQDLESLFGEDPVIFTASQEAELPPMQEALVSLLEPLGDYKDSREMAEKLPEMVDRSDEFFALCRSGELEAARDWLEAWDKPFEDRELWLERIDRFLPLNGAWLFNNGDPSLVAYMAGDSGKPYTVYCRVSLDRDGAVLCFLLSENAESGCELYGDLDSASFRRDEGSTSYLAQLNLSGSLSLNKAVEGNITGGAEYIRG